MGLRSVADRSKLRAVHAPADRQASVRSAAAPVRISAVIITFNSARLLGSVLAALRWCDEIVIVDSGSSDETVAIASQHGCRVLHRPFDGFGTQKGWAVAQARNDWVFVVDDDEIASGELAFEIIEKVHRVEAGTLPFRAFTVPISLVFLGRLMRFGGEYKMPHLRLFNRRFGNYNSARVHEDVVVSGPVGRLRNHMVHDSYGSLDEYVEKLNRYTTAGAEELYEKGKRIASVHVLVRFPLTFIREYALRLNFLNGYPGFVWSMFSAMYPVVKYAKLRELRRTKALPRRDAADG